MICWSGCSYTRGWFACLSYPCSLIITLPNSFSLTFYYFPVYHLILEEDISQLSLPRREPKFALISLKKSLGIHPRKRGIDHVQWLYHDVGLHVAESFSGQSVLDISSNNSVRLLPACKGSFTTLPVHLF